MATTTITARRKVPLVEFVWFDGSNAVEVAQWLQERGTEVAIHFKVQGQQLWVGSYTREVPNGVEGIWVDDKGTTHTEEEIEARWAVEEAR